jgi:VanZ family protein
VEPQGGRSEGSRTEAWTALALCAAVLAAGTLKHLVSSRPAYAQAFAPDWLALAATALAAAGIVPLRGRPRWLRARRALLWSGLLLMVWAANGLPFDLLRLTPLIPLPVDWPGLATRVLALGAAIALARLALAHPGASASTRTATWYGYAAFVLALPYPVLRTWWALGGTPGLGWPGAAGRGWAPLLLAIPWLLAAALSLLLVPTWRWMPRRLLLTAGWFATAVVAMVGPAACWALIGALVGGGGEPIKGIALWVPALFYGSWLLWAIAAGAATRSYQLRSAPSPA